MAQNLKAGEETGNKSLFVRFSQYVSAIATEIGTSFKDTPQEKSLEDDSQPVDSSQQDNSYWTNLSNRVQSWFRAPLENSQNTNSEIIECNHGAEKETLMMTVDVNIAPQKHSQPRPQNRASLRSSGLVSSASMPDLFFHKRPRPWFDNTKKIFGRPPSTTQLHSDVPRLTKHLTLLDCRKGQSSLVFRGDSVPSPENLAKAEKRPDLVQICDFFSALALLEYGEESQQIVKDNFFNIMNENEVIDTQKQEFDKLINTCFGSTNGVTRTLVCISQSIIAPAVIFLRTGISHKVRFKDAQSRIWEIVVRVFDEGKVEITHLRRQVSIDSPGYQFVWKFTLTISINDPAVFDATLTVPEITLDENVPIEARRTIVELLLSHFNPDELPSDDGEIFTSLFKKMPEDI